MDISLHLEPEVALFYTRIAFSSGRSLQEVLSDALFRLAAQLSLEALENAQEEAEEDGH